MSCLLSPFPSPSPCSALSSPGSNSKSTSFDLHLRLPTTTGDREDCQRRTRAVASHLPSLVLCHLSRCVITCPGKLGPLENDMKTMTCLHTTNDTSSVSLIITMSSNLAASALSCTCHPLDSLSTVADRSHFSFLFPWRKFGNTGCEDGRHRW